MSWSWGHKAQPQATTAERDIRPPGSCFFVAGASRSRFGVAFGIPHSALLLHVDHHCIAFCIWLSQQLYLPFAVSPVCLSQTRDEKASDEIAVRSSHCFVISFLTYVLFRRATCTVASGAWGEPLYFELSFGLSHRHQSGTTTQGHTTDFGVFSRST